MSVQIKNLSQLLRPVLGDKEILEYSAYNIIPVGENYGGIILAVDVIIQESDKTEKKHFVAKLKPQNELFEIMFNTQKTFKREMDLYVKIIPMLIDFQKEFNISQNNILDCFPKCYGARLNLSNNNIVDNNALILFENLRTEGYIMEDRMTGFDLNHTKLIIKNLARFHALPIAMKQLKPDVYKQTIASLVPYTFGESFSKGMIKEFCDELLIILNEINCKKYANKIVDLVEKDFTFNERLLEPTGQYLTIVHHDLWANNIMVLRNNTDNPLKIKLFDLQLSSFGSLAHDLIFFLFSSVQQDVFNNHYESLIRLYYDSFIYCLKEFSLNTDDLSWDSFIKEINIIGPHQIAHVIIMLRPIFAQNKSDKNETELTNLSSLNSKFKTKLRDVILAFIKYEWL